MSNELEKQKVVVHSILTPITASISTLNEAIHVMNYLHTLNSGFYIDASTFPDLMKNFDQQLDETSKLIKKYIKLSENMN